MTVDLAVVFPRAVSTGGVERVAADLLADQARRRATVFVGTESTVPDVRIAPVRPARVPRAYAPIAFRRAAAPVIAGVDADTVVTMGVPCPPGDVLWVHSVHRAWLERGGEIWVGGLRVPSRVRYAMARHQVLLGLERRYFEQNSARLILCTSPNEVDDLEWYYGVPRSLTRVVPNSYDPVRFHPGRREARGKARRHRGIDESDVVVLMVANEWHRKGLGVLVRAMAALADRRMRLELVGAADPAPYLALAHRLGIGHRVRWHGPSDDVGAWMALADLFVLPTTYEPFGTVIIEALASGLPVVTTRLAGASTAINPGVTGTLLEDPADVDELVGALATTRDDDLRHRMGVAAAVSVDDYRMETVLDRVDRLIFG